MIPNQWFLNGSVSRMIFNIMNLTSSNQMVPVLVGNRLGSPLQLRLASTERSSVAIRCRSSIALSSTPKEDWSWGLLKTWSWIWWQKIVKLSSGSHQICWECTQFCPRKCNPLKLAKFLQQTKGAPITCFKAQLFWFLQSIWIYVSIAQNMKLSWITNPVKPQHMRCPRTTDSHQLGVVERMGKPIFPDKMECKNSWRFWLWYVHEVER